MTQSSVPTARAPSHWARMRSDSSALTKDRSRRLVPNRRTTLSRYCPSPTTWRCPMLTMVSVSAGTSGVVRRGLREKSWSQLVSNRPATCGRCCPGLMAYLQRCTLTNRHRSVPSPTRALPGSSRGHAPRASMARKHIVSSSPECMREGTKVTTRSMVCGLSAVYVSLSGPPTARPRKGGRSGWTRIGMRASSCTVAVLTSS
mmetsp:Transcript_26504/g.53169  ORF Transcript_26504/g.53169 Transcript_26504/m.53169 type:complete len:202 (-) Transcript_26504:569-1174(-)